MKPNQIIPFHDYKEVMINPSTGEATISRAGLARLLNIPETTLKSHILRRGLSEPDQPLTEEVALDCVEYFAWESKASTGEAKELFKQIGRAGMRACLYHVGGYQIQAVESEPQKEMEMSEVFLAMANQAKAWEKYKKEQAEKEKQLQEELAEKATKRQLAQLEKAVRNNQCPYGYLPKHKLAAFFDTSIKEIEAMIAEDVRTVTYPFASGKGGLKEATAYNIEDTRVRIEM